MSWWIFFVLCSSVFLVHGEETNNSPENQTITLNETTTLSEDSDSISQGEAESQEEEEGLEEGLISALEKASEDSLVFQSLDEDVSPSLESLDELLPLPELFELEINRGNRMNSLSLFKMRVQKSQPHHFTNLSHFWPALAQLKLATLLEAFNSQKNSEIKHSFLESTSRRLNLFEPDLKNIRLSLSSALAQVSTESNSSTGSSLMLLNLTDTQPLIHLSPFPELFEFLNAPQPSVLLHFGTGARLDSFFCDAKERFLISLRGNFSVSLFPPSSSKFLYPKPLVTNNHDSILVSQVNLSSTDFKAHPKFLGRYPTVTKLEAGDLLYIPSFWYSSIKVSKVDKNTGNYIFLEIVTDAASQITKQFHNEYVKKLLQLETSHT